MEGGAEGSPVARRRSEQLVRVSWSCPECRTPLGLRDDLMAHVAGAHLDYFPFTCGVCCLHFASENQARRHAVVKRHLPVNVGSDDGEW